METVGVMVNFPIPVLAAAGTTTGYVMAFVGLVQVVLATQTAVTPVSNEAEVDSVCGVASSVLNVVDVIVRFQPLPEPVASVVVIASA